MTTKAEAPPPDAPEAPSDLWPSEQLLSDAIGRLMEFWGFKRHMGRIWTVLYLSDEPLGATRVEVGVTVEDRRGIVGHRWDIGALTAAGKAHVSAQRTAGRSSSIRLQ